MKITLRSLSLVALFIGALASSSCSTNEVRTNIESTGTSDSTGNDKNRPAPTVNPEADENTRIPGDSLPGNTTLPESQVDPSKKGSAGPEPRPSSPQR